MSNNPYEPPQTIVKAESEDLAKRPFSQQIILLLAFQAPALILAALVLDGGRVFQVTAATCIVMWLALLIMHLMNKVSKPDSDQKP